jgi:hypothetical protein
MDMLKIAVLGLGVVVFGAGLTACNKNQGESAPAASGPQLAPGGSSGGATAADTGGSSSSSSGAAAAGGGMGSSSGA